MTAPAPFELVLPGPVAAVAAWAEHYAQGAEPFAQLRDALPRLRDVRDGDRIDFTPDDHTVPALQIRVAAEGPTQTRLTGEFRILGDGANKIAAGELADLVGEWPGAREQFLDSFTAWQREPAAAPGTPTVDLEPAGAGPMEDEPAVLAPEPWLDWQPATLAANRAGRLTPEQVQRAGFAPGLDRRPGIDVRAAIDADVRAGVCVHLRGRADAEAGSRFALLDEQLVVGPPDSLVLSSPAPAEFFVLPRSRRLINWVGDPASLPPRPVPSAMADPSGAVMITAVRYDAGGREQDRAVFPLDY